MIYEKSIKEIKEITVNTRRPQIPTIYLSWGYRGLSKKEYYKKHRESRILIRPHIQRMVELINKDINTKVARSLIGE